jgi:hypothetical protein
MAIIVRLSRVSPKTPAPFWIEQAIAAGTKDEYGNVFRALKLFWKGDANHRMTPYVKTKGFQDAEISQDGQQFIVTYRHNGSLWWQQPVTGIGAFYAECPMTTYNIKKLASCYGDGLWTFSREDKDVEQVVKDMYEKRIVNLPEEMKKFNEARIKGMHTHVSDVNVQAASIIAPDIEDQKKALDDQQTEILLEKERLRKKEVELAQREENADALIAGMADSGVSLTPYSEEFLKTQKFHELKKLAKTIGVVIPVTAKKDEIIVKIRDFQAGKVEVPAPASQPEQDSLED